MEVWLNKGNLREGFGQFKIGIQKNPYRSLCIYLLMNIRSKTISLC